jgi:pimeloyl-ACP methyl ester carboxylesterase
MTTGFADLPEVPGTQIRHREVVAGRVRLHVAEAGAGPPLLLLHGWPQHWWSWRELIPRFAEDHRVIAPDLRGWGWSEAPPGDYAKATFAADIAALLEAEGLERVRVIGHDWGGYAGFLLALEHPGKVERLVALDIPPPWGSPPRPSHLALPLLLSYQVVLAVPGLGEQVMTRSGAFVKAIIRGATRRRTWTDAELDVYANVLRQPARARASSACYRTFLTKEIRGALRPPYRPRDLAVPSLLLMGAASAIQRVVDPQASLNLDVRLIEGAGHFLPEEAADEVNELARSFFES